MAWAEVSSELAEICWLVAESSSLALATCCAFSEMARIIALRLPFTWLTARVKSPSSSSLRICKSFCVKSPSAIASARPSTDRVVLEMRRLRKAATKIPMVRAVKVVTRIVRFIERVAELSAS